MAHVEKELSKTFLYKFLYNIPRCFLQHKDIEEEKTDYSFPLKICETTFHHSCAAHT